VPGSGWQQGPDRAYDLITPLELDAMPGVEDLAQAAALFGVELAEVERAARRVRPLVHASGHQVWSTRQLARQIVKDRAGRPLTRDQALAVRELAARVGIRKAAKKSGRGVSSIYGSWRKYGIPPLTDRQNRGGNGGAVLDRDQAEAMVRYLAEHGPDKTAAKFSIARQGVYRTLKRYGIRPPIGRGAPGRPRPRAREAA
jgi:DNA invertase Pin-like site-specific DNA recombinase